MSLLFNPCHLLLHNNTLTSSFYLIQLGLFWSSHQRFFRSLCIASKVNHAISLSKKALEEDKCVVIGLQSTGEAASKAAAEIAGFNDDQGGLGFVSAPGEDIKRVCCFCSSDISLIESLMQLTIFLSCLPAYRPS